MKCCDDLATTHVYRERATNGGPVLHFTRIACPVCLRTAEGSGDTRQCADADAKTLWAGVVQTA